MIDIQKYLPNTLRKGRSQAFQKDIGEVYRRYCEILHPQSMNIKCFDDIWTETHVKYIFQCRAEEQDEDEYAQLLYEIVFKQYFFNQDKKNKVFALFTLYFLYYSCERRRKIFISKPYIDELSKFIKQNAEDKQLHYMKICVNLLRNCLTFASKIGLRKPMIQPTGEVLKKTVVIRADPLTQMKKIKEEIKSVGESYNKYIKEKENLQKLGEKNLKQLKLASTDKYFLTRMETLVQNYEKYISEDKMDEQ